MKTIVLIDLFSGGHRDAFMQLFSLACLQNNTKVICLYPNAKKIKIWISDNKNINLENILFIDYEPKIKYFKNFGRLNDSISRILYWKSCNKILKKIEKIYQLKIDLVYFNWLDSQMANYFPVSILDRIFSYKWSGLYFHPTIFRINETYLNAKVKSRDIDAIFTSKKCVAITIHDEGILEKYQNRIGKKVILFPEIADATPPNFNISLASKIKEKANGRTIVGIIGLEPYKGSYALMQLVAKADATKYFFAFTGVYQEKFIHKLSSDKQKKYKDFIQNLPENCIWETGSLKEGEEYNTIFCSFDIAYIMYKNFYSSSNRLTKAAIFNRLVLGNNYGCVGDDIPKYNLGETADEDDIDEQYQKLEILRDKIINNDLPYEQWKIYSEKHSTDRLKEKFEELLNLI